MVRVRRRILGNRTYYYLEHSVRTGRAVQKRERYLGGRLPRDLKAAKERFLREVRAEHWGPVLQAIHRGYASEIRRTPASARERNLEAFAVEFTYNTQRIEGSTLTLRETANLLLHGRTPSERPLGDVQEAESHRTVFRSLLGERKDLSMSLVLRWHHEMFRTSRPDIAGSIREHQVAIPVAGSSPRAPVEVYPLLREFFRWYDRAKGQVHPVNLAALVHLKFVTVHPFSDGNGRVARLLTNFVLHHRRFPMLDIPYAGRNRYYAALERAHVRREDTIFVQWFLRRYIRENRRFVPKGTR